MRVVVGRVAKAHGIRGEVSIEVRTDEPEARFAPGATVWAGETALTVRSARRHQGRLLATFEQIADRTAAEALHGSQLLAEIDPDATAPEDDEYYDRHLVGLTVRDAHGADRGAVVAVEHLPAQDLLVVDVAGERVRIPFVTALVPQIDVPGGFLQIADIRGLLDPAEADHAD